MSRRPSFSQIIFPANREFMDCIKTLKDDGSRRMLGFLWSGYDQWKAEVLDRAPIEPSRQQGDLERDLTDLYFPYAMRAMPKSLPYYLHPEKKEHESAIPRAQPPEPDLSFVLLANPRITFPIDAKVIERDFPGNLTDYIETINTRFLPCVYAPFSTQGAMLAFVLNGSIATIFGHIATGLSTTLSRTTFFRGRDHKTSDHIRVAITCHTKPFRCHHLMMPVGIMVSP